MLDTVYMADETLAVKFSDMEGVAAGAVKDFPSLPKPTMREELLVVYDVGR